MNTSACKACGGTMRWLLTENGRRMAVDPDPNERGNVVIVRVGFRGEEHCRVLKKDEEALTARYIHHRATCPADR